MLQFTCSGCDTVFNVPEEYAGRRGRCRICSTHVEAPALRPQAREAMPAWERPAPGAHAMPSGGVARMPGVYTGPSVRR